MKLLLKINLLLLFVLSNIIFAQSTNSNHRKYWWYKSRLNNDFVKVGTGDGESFPFNQRGATGDGFTSPDVRSNMFIGDGTSTLGLYIAQLATEYALLIKNSQNTETVINELYCALNAFDRVDYKAENLWQSGTYLLNGFFVRDDIPKNFTRANYKHFNYYSTWDGSTTKFNIPNGDPNTFDLGDHGFHSNCQTGMFKTTSSWSTYVDDNHHTGLFAESQDQAYDLLLGLAFVNKFVTQGVVTNKGMLFPYTGEVGIREQARNQAKRIINYIRDPKKVDGTNCNSSYSQGWNIKNPTTCISVSTGDDARVYGYPLAELENTITGGGNIPQGNVGLTIGIPTNGSTYHNTYSYNFGFPIWSLAASTPIYNANNPTTGMDTRVFNTNIAAMCDCVYGTVIDEWVDKELTTLQNDPVLSNFGIILEWFWSTISITLHYLVPGYYKNITDAAITTNAYPYGAPIDHGPIAHALLNSKSSYVPNPQYTFDYLLNIAPCDGIYNFGSNQSNYEWSSDNRCDHPNRRGDIAGVGEAAPKGEYNGIDFMLYHNLYYLYNNENTMTNLSDITINNPSNLGCSNVNAYETIDARNTSINCTSPTYWRAGKTIYFGQGFSITGNGSSTFGPNFHAYIQKFDCATDVGAYRMANTDSTGQVNSLSNDSYANGVKYHTVNYPPNEMATLNTEPVTEHNQNLITELPPDEDPIDNALKLAYPDYSRELFVKPTVTIDYVKAYFTMDDNEIAFITVMDLSGKKVFSNDAVKPSDTGLTIDLSSYAAGSYILKFTTTKGTNKTQKIIKQ